MKTLPTFSCLLICSLIVFSFSACEKKNTAFYPAPESAGSGPAGALKSIVSKRGLDYVTDYHYENDQLKSSHTYVLDSTISNDTIERNLYQYKNGNRLIEQTNYNFSYITTVTTARYMFNALGRLDSYEISAPQINMQYSYSFEYKEKDRLDVVNFLASGGDGRVYYSFTIKINAYRNNNITEYTIITDDTLSTHYEIEYDNNPNPFHQQIFGLTYNEIYTYFSENNAKSIKITEAGQQFLIDFTYVYNSKSLPSHITSTQDLDAKLEYY